ADDPQDPIEISSDEPSLFDRVQKPTEGELTVRLPPSGGTISVTSHCPCPAMPPTRPSPAHSSSPPADARQISSPRSPRPVGASTRRCLALPSAAPAGHLMPTPRRRRDPAKTLPSPATGL